MNLTLESFEETMKLFARPTDPLLFVLSKSEYEHGIELFGKEAMDKEIIRYGLEVVE